MYVNLVLIASSVFVYSLLAGRIEKTAISGPIILTIVCTILGSILLHGITANPIIKLLFVRKSKKSL